jgi:hypothetical protein
MPVPDASHHQAASPEDGLEGKYVRKLKLSSGSQKLVQPLDRNLLTTINSVKDFVPHQDRKLETTLKSFQVPASDKAKLAAAFKLTPESADLPRDHGERALDGDIKAKLEKLAPRLHGGGRRALDGTVKVKLEKKPLTLPDHLGDRALGSDVKANLDKAVLRSRARKATSKSSSSKSGKGKGSSKSGKGKGSSKSGKGKGSSKSGKGKGSSKSGKGKGSIRSGKGKGSSKSSSKSKS